MCLNLQMSRYTGWPTSFFADCVAGPSQKCLLFLFYTLLGPPSKHLPWDVWIICSDGAIAIIFESWCLAHSQGDNRHSINVWQVNNRMNWILKVFCILSKDNRANCRFWKEIWFIKHDVVPLHSTLFLPHARTNIWLYTNLHFLKIFDFSTL